jgi:hypothetical protein
LVNIFLRAESRLCFTDMWAWKQHTGFILVPQCPLYIMNGKPAKRKY